MDAKGDKLLRCAAIGVHRQYFDFADIGISGIAGKDDAGSSQKISINVDVVAFKIAGFRLTQKSAIFVARDKILEIIPHTALNRERRPFDAEEQQEFRRVTDALEVVHAEHFAGDAPDLAGKPFIPIVSVEPKDAEAWKADAIPPAFIVLSPHRTVRHAAHASELLPALYDGRF
ncbi:MAG: hypothetical protein AB7E81_20495 [Hyphomicrobiaceae bacterium]